MRACLAAALATILAGLPGRVAPSRPAGASDESQTMVDAINESVPATTWPPYRRDPALCVSSGAFAGALMEPKLSAHAEPDPGRPATFRRLGEALACTAAPRPGDAPPLDGGSPRHRTGR